jgi:hypothetical protein
VDVCVKPDDDDAKLVRQSIGIGCGVDDDRLRCIHAEKERDYSSALCKEPENVTLESLYVSLLMDQDIQYLLESVVARIIQGPML